MGPIGPNTLVKISSDSRRSPFSASPSTVSALVLAYTSAVSKVRDAGVERGPDAGLRLLVLDLRAVGQPVAVGDLGDLEAGVAEVAEIHRFNLPWGYPNRFGGCCDSASGRHRSPVAGRGS